MNAPELVGDFDRSAAAGSVEAVISTPNAGTDTANSSTTAPIPVSIAPVTHEPR